MSSSRLRKLLLPLLRAVERGVAPTFRMKSAARQGLFLLENPKTKGKGGRLRRIQKRTTENKETAEIREKVFRRAVGLCEVPGCIEHASDLDHWLSGSGRRREKQSFENCWALCVECHLARTNNAPSAAYWNETFAAHCRIRGFAFTPHITHAQLKRSAP